MGEVQIPEKAKLVVGLLTGQRELLRTTQDELESMYGPVELASEVWSFETTQYYEDELGPSIVRQFLCFAEPFAMDRMAGVKLETNALELRLAESLSRPPRVRPVNIDPGYLTLGSLVLGTTKNRAHRIYLGGGIFAEVTLVYEDGEWMALPWTYPDYRESHYHGFLKQVRTLLKKQRRARS